MRGGTTPVGNAPGPQQGTAGSVRKVQGDSRAERERMATLFYLCPGSRAVPIVAAVEERIANDLLSGRVVRTLRGQAAAVELAAAAQAIAGEDVELSGSPPAGAASPAAPFLTAREAEVLALVARGCSDEEAAISLGIAGCTVRFHLKNIYAKLGLSGRAKAVAWAARHGLG